MSVVPYWQVDAFANAPGRGNPAGVLILDGWPGDAALQAMAADLAQPATAFLVRDGMEWQLRWFSPAAELWMCGHGTLAAGHVVAEMLTSLLTRAGGGLGPSPAILPAVPAFAGKQHSLRFNTRRAGVLEVAREHGGYILSLPVVPTERSDFAETNALFAAQEVWGNASGYTVFLFTSADEIEALAPDFTDLATLGAQQFICTAPGAGHRSGADVVSRVFVGGAGEDAATGSAHAVLTPFWAARLGRNTFTAHQASARGGDFTCRMEGDRVLLGGRCVTVIEGTYRLPGR